MTADPRLIAGTVLDAAGQPVARARVSIVVSPVAMPDLALLTDTSGRFALGAPAPGRYRLGIDSDTAGSLRVTVEVGAASPAALAVRLPGRCR